MNKVNKKTNIKDVARLAGVSIATVSRALKSPNIVSKRTLEKVHNAIKEAEYTPDLMARSLRTRRTGNIVVIFPDITQPYNAGIIKAIESAAHEVNYSVLLGDTQNRFDRERAYAKMVSSRQADGIILLSPHLPFDIDYEQPIADQLPPLVNASEPVPEEGIAKVLIDNVAAGYKATQHLLHLGHKRIAIITGAIQSPSAQDRFAGYKLALKEAGVALDEALIQYGDYRIEPGSICAYRLLQHKPRPTAIFCCNDEMAIGAMRTIHAHGLSIPNDISVVGFDNVWYAEYHNPSLTTIKQPVEQMGRMAMQFLYDIILGNPPPEENLFLPFELVIRESSGPPPRRR